MSLCFLLPLLLSRNGTTLQVLKWLSLPDVGHLDSACCNYAIRPEFLDVIQRSNLLATINKLGDVRAFPSLASWVLKRNVTLSYGTNFSRVEVSQEDCEIILHYALQILLLNSPIGITLALWMIMHASNSDAFSHVVSAQSLQTICNNLASENPSLVNMALHTGKTQRFYNILKM